MGIPGSLPVDVWPYDGDIEDVVPGIPRDVDPTVVALANAAATEVLWALSGRRYGYRTETIRPCSQYTESDLPWWYWARASQYAVTWAGPRLWSTSMWCRSCEREYCSHTQMHEFRLPRFPVVEITDLLIDGQHLPVTGANVNFRMDEYRWLVRTDGDPWPMTQDLSLPLTDAGTWSVSYRWGRAVPALGEMAQVALAGELVKMSLDMECQLPQRVTSVSRQGVAFTVNDPLDFLENGRTGIYVVDLFLTTYNRQGAQRPARVFRVDGRHGGRRTGT